jgi:outer membrane lipoprotein carrier protein
VNRALLSLLGLALLAPPAARGACGSTADCLRAIEQAQSATQTLQAEFVQTKHVSLLDQPLVSRGRFSFKRPDRVRLEIREPETATLVIRGKEVSIPGVSKAETDGMAMTPAAAMFSRLGALFTGATRELEGDFEVAAHADGAAIEVELTPRQERWKKLLRRIGLRFSGPDLMVEQIHLDEPLGDRLEIALQDVRRNVELPDSLFQP